MAPERLAVLALLLTAMASGAAGAKDVCDSPVTTDIVACAQKQLREAETDLDRYLAGVRAAIADRPADLAALEAAQKAWSAFVELDCKAVYEHWIDGTVRGPFVVACKVDHTERRTCSLWDTYLQMAVTKLEAPKCRDR
jgi:uncharacterized protein YecT (DUF1311 family)